MSVGIRQRVKRSRNRRTFREPGSLFETELGQRWTVHQSNQFIRLTTDDWTPDNSSVRNPFGCRKGRESDSPRAVVARPELCIIRDFGDGNFWPVGHVDNFGVDQYISDPRE